MSSMGDIIENVQQLEQVHHASNGDQSRSHSVPISCHGHFHSSVLLIAVLTGVATALAVIPGLMSSSHHEDKMYLSLVVFPSIGSISAVAMTLICLIFILKRNTWLKNGRVKYIGKIPMAPSSINGRYLALEPTHDNVHLITPPTRSNKWYHLSPISVFGIGGGICLICSFIIKMYPSPHEIALALNAIAMLISLIVQVIFYALYNGAILQNNAIFHYLIALMIAYKIAIWITLTLFALPWISPGNTLVNYTDISPSSILNITDISPQNDKINSTLEVLKLFLEPFYIEFLTISVAALFQLWNLMTKEQDNSVKMATTGDRVPLLTERDERCGAAENMFVSREEIAEHSIPETDDEDDNEENGSLYTESNSLPLLQVHTRRWVTRLEKLATVLFIAFLIIIAISYFLSEQMLYVGPLHSLVGDKIKPSVANYIFRGIQIVVDTPYFLICIITIYKLYKKNNSSRFGPAPFNSSDYLLIFTAIVGFIWKIMKIVAAGLSLSRTTDHLNSTDNIYTMGGNKHESITKVGVIFMLLYYILCIFMILVQTQVILAAHSFQRLGYSNSKLTKLCLAYVIAQSMPQWLQGALDRENLIYQYNHFTPELNEYFGEDTVRMLTFILYPFMSLYKFHSAVMAYEILK